MASSPSRASRRRDNTESRVCRRGLGGAAHRVGERIALQHGTEVVPQAPTLLEQLLRHGA